MAFVRTGGRTWDSLQLIRTRYLYSSQTVSGGITNSNTWYQITGDRIGYWIKPTLELAEFTSFASMQRKMQHLFSKLIGYYFFLEMLFRERCGFGK